MIESHPPSSDGEQGFNQSTRTGLPDIRTWKDGGGCHKKSHLRGSPLWMLDMDP